MAAALHGSQLVHPSEVVARKQDAVLSIRQRDGQESPRSLRLDRALRVEDAQLHAAKATEMQEQEQKNERALNSLRVAPT
mmetsp:Transcript_127055/g.406601  ORF Transcript_127055/g.406601 Transcript_127055/m.406601 type:complete len:80 (+) Transcript_127055:40-279(+)